ncbi:MAG: hypothetical protein JWN41_718 [Thermoleophilia bacterium]|nr:hypothetical protein [Thermoleophilia bacterium]
MQLTHTPAPVTFRTDVVSDAGAAPRGWSPGSVDPAPSSRARGLVRGALDAWRGVRELSLGAALTATQISTLAPFLAGRLALDEQVVRGDLDRVRVQVGGLAYNAPNMATTVGLNIYVADASTAARILSWPGRNWLVHELTHTMQWRRGSTGLVTDAARDRRFLDHYLGAFIAHDGKLSDGGLVRAARELARRHRDGDPTGPLGDVVHDTHPMENEAIEVARDFARAYSH